MASKNLVIVESPAKAKTITKFLGKDYTVLASYGHVRDLPKSKLGIDIDKEFKPMYITSTNKFTKQAIKNIKDAYDKNTTLYIATDEDREGEAIGWHILKLLKIKNESEIKRIVFHEITKQAILDSLDNPRSIDSNLVNAQQARRVLDRIVGYYLSPLLWKKIQPGLSAGRVQSVTLKLIVEREREIENFDIESFFKVKGLFHSASSNEFKAQISDKFNDIEGAKKFLEKCRESEFSVSNIEKKPGKKSPSAPFTTSTMQQEAYRKLGFSVKRTMVVAQKLYETGKITYMRTDSVNLSDFAIENASQKITESYGKEYLNIRKFETKSKGAQEAHEAIRPTDFNTETAGKDDDEERLYSLIWKRALASQMTDAKLEKTTIKIDGTKTDKQFEAKGEVVIFDGFMKIFSTNGDSETNILPILKNGDSLKYSEITAEEGFTKPPARYNEATLVRTLEEMGIGRPSTYAPTISTIQDRGYAIKEDRVGEELETSVLTLKDNNIETIVKTIVKWQEKSKLFPTAIGEVVNDFLCKYFTDILDYKFTAKVETEFDEISEGGKKWNKMIKDFYESFNTKVEDTTKNVSRKEANQTRELGEDPKTGKPISARIGRYGPFVQIGIAEDDEKPKFAKIPKGKDMNTITLEDAIELFKLPRVIGKDKDGDEVSANVGRFGPYVKVNDLFVSIKNLDPMTVTIEEVLDLIEEKKKAKAESTIMDFKEDNVKILKGKWGPYVTNGKRNVKIPKEIEDPKVLTLNECKELLKSKPKGRRKK